MSLCASQHRLACGSQKRGSDAPESELQGVLIHPAWVREPTPAPQQEHRGFFNPGAASPALLPFLKCLFQATSLGKGASDVTKNGVPVQRSVL